MRIGCAQQIAAAQHAAARQLNAGGDAGVIQAHAQACFAALFEGQRDGVADRDIITVTDARGIPSHHRRHRRHQNKK